MSMTGSRPLQKWRPVKLGPADTTVLSVVLALISLVRGYDYLTGSDVWGATTGEPPPALVGIEGAFPLWLWGAALVATAVIMFAGMLRKWHFWVFFAHSVFAILYTGLFAGLSGGYLNEPNFDGIRGAAGLSMGAIYCLIVAVRMGARPLELWRA